MWKAFQSLNPGIRPFDPSQRAKAVRELMLQKLQKIADLPGMEMFQAVDRDQLPKPYHTFQTFINQSATPDVSKSKVVMVDWNVPIRVKLILLPDDIT